MFFILFILLFSGGPYAAFAGRDASRGLATFSVTPSEKEYDDLSDLNSQEMESVREWEEQFQGSYFYLVINKSVCIKYNFLLICYVIYRKIQSSW